MPRDDFKPIKAPKREPKPAPPINTAPIVEKLNTAAMKVLRRLLRASRWDEQGGYSGRHNGKWSFISTGLPQVSPEELDILFAFAGMTADEIEVVGDCADCANSINGRERGYAQPCGSCLRPSHINNFVPAERLTSSTKLAQRRAKATK